MSIATALLAGACSATDYQKWGFNGGYRDKEVTPGVFLVEFGGSRYTKPAVVEGYWHRRAEEVCSHSGFEIVTGPRMKCAEKKDYDSRKFPDGPGPCHIVGHVRCKDTAFLKAAAPAVAPPSAAD